MKPSRALRFFSLIFLTLTLLILPNLDTFGASPGDVVISEFSTRGASSAYDEFVEIYNPKCSDIDISNWTLEYYSGSSWGIKLTVPASTTLPSGRFYLMASNNTYFTTCTADLYRSTYLGLADGTAASPRGLRIKDGSGTVIDTVVFGGTGCSANSEAEGNSTSPNHGTSANNNSVERKAFSASTANSLASGGADETAGNAEDTNNNCSDFVKQTNGRNPQSLLSGQFENPPSCGGDTTPPQVTSTTPNTGAVSVGLNQNIIFIFDEAMDQTTTEAAFSINPDVSGKVFAWNGADTQMTVSHNVFTQNQPYAVKLSSTAEDTSGNGLDADGDGNTGPDFLLDFQTVGLDGSGTCTVLPISVENNVYDSFDFLFTATGDLTGGQVEITIPVNWSGPQTSNASNDGYTTITAGGGATVSIFGITGSGPWLILVDCTNLEVNETFTLKYGDGNKSKCTVDSDYTFTTKSKGSGGTLTAIGVSPEINVYTPGAGDGTGTASLDYQDNDPIYAGGIGNYVYIDFVPGAYGIYKVAMVVPSNWSVPSASNVDIILDGTTPLSKDSAYFSTSGQEVIYNFYALGSVALNSSQTLSFRFKGFESSSNVSDNDFVIKSSASDPATPVVLAVSSPISVNMTNTKWYTIYFNDSVEISYAATTNLQATTVGKNLGSGLDQQFTNRINSVDYDMIAAFYTAGVQSVETALVNKNGGGINIRWWCEEDYWNSENNFHSDLESDFGGADVRNDKDDAPPGSGLSHNKFAIFDYNESDDGFTDVIWTGSWNMSNNGTTKNSQNVITFSHNGIAAIYYDEFDTNFYSGLSGSSKSVLTGGRTFSVGGGLKQQFGRSDNNVEVYFSPKDNVNQKIIDAINTANDSIYFCVFTFTDLEIYQAIKNRWLAGVKVEGVFDTFQAGSQYSKYNDMIADGMEVKKDSVV
ncbi:lamin tail domain-containing protein, partial [Candidatus Dependentiae bacterium]|nr:lamin tail domain-containing protein [Candidatus Dependentiae bacterium]